MAIFLQGCADTILVLDASLRSIRAAPFTTKKY